MKEFNYKEEIRKLEDKELKRYLKYYGLSDMSEMSEEQLEEFCNYFNHVKWNYIFKIMKWMADGKIFAEVK